MSTYLGRAALEQLRDAQAIIDEHVATNAAGFCLTCGHQEPCAARRAANAIFMRYGRLPRRKPGLASSEDPSTTFNWLSS